MPFQAKITRARWVLGPFTSEDMLDIGNVVVDAIKLRLSHGVNCNDMDAKPLKPGRDGHRGYPDYKKAAASSRSATGSGRDERRARSR